MRLEAGDYKNGMLILEKDRQGRRTYYKVRCHCGKVATLRSDSKAMSCGCLAEKTRFKKKHGKINHRLYNIWSGMKGRCNNPNDSNYHRYGGRGIKICDEWLGENGFQNFYDWSMNNGYADNLSIDRMDNDKGYSPSNCRWATNEQQQNNIRRNNYIEINGEVKSLSMWSRLSGVPRTTIMHRLERGVKGADLLLPAKKIKQKSGEQGVVWDKHKEKWLVRLRIDNKVKYIGSSKEIEDAIKLKHDFLSELL